MPSAEYDSGDASSIPSLPSDVLLELIVCLLAPLFMAGCSGDLGYARLAAIETVAAYQARSQSELVKIVQVIGFSLMSLDNMRLSMLPGLSLSMVMRLRAGANALNRSAQQTARALDTARRDNVPQQASTAERAAMAAAEPVATPPARQPAAPSAPAPRPAKPCQANVALRAPAVPLPALTIAQRRQLKWADAMTAVAGELAEDLANLPAVQRRSNRLWADALGSAASSLAIAAGSVSI